MAKNSKVSRIAYFDDRSAHVDRVGGESAVYENVTFKSRLRLEQFAWLPFEYSVTISLVGGMAVFIRPVEANTA